ncbi:MAG: BspA family leucine-rich repeat surface protein [Clostridia bacterium]|nr:BspA family leucine-rich repeat surface protein [Clostridia bacterium]
MSYMFYNGYSDDIKNGIVNWNTSKVTDMSYMFNKYGYSIDNLDLSNWDTSKVTNMSNMFNGYKGTSVNLNNWNTSKVTNMASMFAFCSGLTSLNLSSFNTSNVIYMDYMFNTCTNLNNINLTKFNTSKVINMSHMFTWCSGLTSLNLSSFNTSNVIDMSMMFDDCYELTSISFGSNFNTSKVTDMRYMFYGCEAITTLDLSSFNTSKVTNMMYMFNDCEAITTLDLSTFNTSKVTTMECMFNGCSSLTSLDLSVFNTLNVTDMDYMFKGDVKLKTIYASSSFIISNLRDSNKMFTDCTLLVGGSGTTYNASYVDKTYAHIDGGTSNPGYFSYKVSSYTVHFNSNGGTGSMSDMTFTGTQARTINNSFTVPSGFIFKEWNTKEDGSGLSYSNGESVSCLASKNNEEVVLYAIWNNSNSDVRLYSHTSNINDNGVASEKYASNLAVNDVVSIPGATQLNIEVWFSTESITHDWLAIYPAGVTPSASNYSSATISRGKLGGGKYTTKPADSNTTYHKTFTVQGDTAQFFFRSDGSANYYGYYAIITDGTSLTKKTITTNVRKSIGGKNDEITNYTKNIGESITITAPSSFNTSTGEGIDLNNEYTFKHWRDIETGEILSTNNSYTFTVTKSMYVEAVYEKGFGFDDDLDF